MSVRIVSSGVPHSKKDCQEVLEKLTEDMAMFACTLEMIRSGDNSAVEPCKEYIRDKIKRMDASCMQAELVMLLSFMRDGYEYFSKKLKAMDKAGEN